MPNTKNSMPNSKTNVPNVKNRVIENRPEHQENVNNFCTEWIGYMPFSSVSLKEIHSRYTSIYGKKALTKLRFQNLLEITLEAFLQKDPNYSFYNKVRTAKGVFFENIYLRKEEPEVLSSSNNLETSSTFKS